jgi:hypothetical protein
MHSPDSRQNPVIYNLFPRLVGDLTRWPLHAERAAAMGFNWLYVNPIFFCWRLSLKPRRRVGSRERE